MEFTGKRSCHDCGKWFPPDEIRFGPDPFRSEIRGDDTPIWQCYDCIALSHDEI